MIKKIMLLVFLSVTAIVAFAQQTVNGDRVIARNAFYLNDYWLRGVQRDTSLSQFGDSSKVPTAKAVADYVGGRVLAMGGGSGSVTSVSGLSPLFSVSNATTTPTFALSNAAAYTNFGNRSGSTGPPSYYLNPFLDTFKRSNDSVFGRLNGSWVFQYKLSPDSSIYNTNGSIPYGVNRVITIPSPSTLKFSGDHLIEEDVFVFESTAPYFTSKLFNIKTNGNSIFSVGKDVTVQPDAEALMIYPGTYFFNRLYLYNLAPNVPNATDSMLIRDTAGNVSVKALPTGGGTDDLNDVAGRDSITSHNIEVRGNNKYIGTASDGIAFGSSFLTHNETVGGGVAVSDPSGNTATITAHKIDVDDFDYDVATSTFNVGFLGNNVLQKTGNNYYFGDKDGINNQSYLHINDGIKSATIYADSLKLRGNRVLSTDKIFAGAHINKRDSAGGVIIEGVASEFKVAYPVLLSTDTIKVDTSATGVATKTDVYNSRPYKVLVGNLTQSATSAPVFTIFENTTGVSYTTARNFAGDYQITSTSGTPFTINKTQVYISNYNSVAGATFNITGFRIDGNTTINISTQDAAAFSGVDETLQNTAIEIRIYP